MTTLTTVISMKRPSAKDKKTNRGNGKGKKCGKDKNKRTGNAKNKRNDNVKNMKGGKDKNKKRGKLYKRPASAKSDDGMKLEQGDEDLAVIPKKFMELFHAADAHGKTRGAFTSRAHKTVYKDPAGGKALAKIAYRKAAGVWEAIPEKHKKSK